MEFNQEQKEAINHGNGPCMVLAGPGSGKTAVITGRIHRLVRELNVPAEQVLVITFTKAAAEEMRQRYLKTASPSDYGVAFGTFHAVFFKILRESDGVSGKSIITTSDQYKIISAALYALHPDHSYVREDFKRILSEISRRKSGMNTNDSRMGLPCTAAEFETVFERYILEMKKLAKMDFDDILSKCHALLQNNGEVRKLWQKRFRYILVDEFQDINRLQYDTVRLLAAPLNNLFAVGDDDQSIYAFRGAQPGLVDVFLDDYPDSKRIVLGKNYRSAPCITTAACSVIRHNASHRNKKITNALSKRGVAEVVVCEDRRGEYRKICEILKNTAVPFEETAVLFRTNMQPRGLAEQLYASGIPFSLKENLPDYSNHWITRDLMCFMKIAEGDRSRKLYLRICNRPERGIARESFPSEAVNPADCIKHAKDNQKKQLMHLFDGLSLLHGLDPYGACFYIRRALGYERFIDEYAYNHGCDKADLFDLLEDLQESARDVKNCAEWEEKLKKTYGETAEKNGETASSVKLMTFHASKGLEFEKVIIADANDGVTPLKAASTDAAIEEERRAFYVAMTRAKTELTVFYVKKRGGRIVLPSRFVNEMLTSPLVRRP